jgi:hypothetical protein
MGIIHEHIRRDLEGFADGAADGEMRGWNSDDFFQGWPVAERETAPTRLRSGALEMARQRGFPTQPVVPAMQTLEIHLDRLLLN